MIIIMAVIVGFVIIAVIKPIYDSYSTIGAGV
jgi:type IV pilus assembly protein PilC